MLAPPLEGSVPPPTGDPGSTPDSVLSSQKSDWFVNSFIIVAYWPCQQNKKKQPMSWQPVSRIK